MHELAVTPPFLFHRSAAAMDWALPFLDQEGESSPPKRAPFFFFLSATSSQS